MMFGRRVVLNLGIKIPNKVIVHHIDENPINNSLKNLMIMSGKNHGKIHGFLREQRIINKGIYGDKLNTVWRKILIKLNFVWIQQQKIELILIEKNNIHDIEIHEDNIYIFSYI